jgi:apolipoprotein N-acyltransferase
MILKIILSLLASFFYSMGVPSVYHPQFFLGAVISLVFYFSCLEGRLKSDLWVTFVYVFGMFVFGYYWIPQTISEFGEIPLGLAYILSIFSPLALMPHFFCFVIFYFMVRKKVDRFPEPLRNCFLAFALTILEYFIPQQFPANIGHPFLLIAPYLGLAKIFGVPIFSFFSAWLSFSIVSLIKKRGKDYVGMALFLLFLISNLIYPLKYEPQDQPGNVSTRIRMVQANIGNFLKVDSEKGGVVSKIEVDTRLTTLSTRPSARKLDLILWPETSYPSVFQSSQMLGNNESTPSVIRDILSQTNSQLFFGGYDRNGQTPLEKAESTYNSAFLLSENGSLEGVFHKQILMPFGESLPFGHLNKYMIPYLENHMSFFARGDKFTLFKLKNKSSFISAICYEILFPQYIRQYLNSSEEQPHFIINLTNDSWYGRTSEPFQHLFLSHWRAIEFNLPVVRMTNTGISSVLYPDGTESKRTRLYSQEIFDFDLTTYPRSATYYQRWGIIPFSILFMVIYFSLLFFLKRNIFSFNFKRNTFS